ncbi:MAG: hypothetical protein QOE46_2648 [Acidobacteriota bacterium]|jgi:hypothetical protein|nr:hypothetical protein [Acidobacteriota bacterium]
MTEQIRVLFLATNPIESSRLRLGEELRLINREIRSGTNGHLFDVSSAWAVRPEDLYEMLLIHRPNIVHLSGHATKSKGIILEDDAGSMSPISSQGLAGLLKVFSESVRMVFLNMCYTQGYVEELAGVVDYVIGIKNQINDKGAIVFSTSFYKGLSFGFPVKIAFEVAANQMLLQRLPYHNSPILKVRETVNDSVPLLTVPNMDISGPVTMELTEGEVVVNRAMTPVFKESNSIGCGVSNGLKSGHAKRKKKHKNIKSSMRGQISELRRDVSKLRVDLQKLAAVIMKTASSDEHQ